MDKARARQGRDVQDVRPRLRPRRIDVRGAAYTLTLHRQDGADERMAVMAVWTVGNDGKVTELREVDAPAA
jgi:hypothetical protein